jgi:hypothetical protein
MMRRLGFLAPIILAACTQPSPGKDWDATFSPYGKWKSDLGFTIEIAHNGRYEVCDHAQCASGRHVEYQNTLLLMNFLNLEPTRRLQQEADIVGICDDKSCPSPGETPDPTDIYNWRNDIRFYDNVADVAHREICGGDRECIILGNVETREGMFYKIRG